MFKTMSLAGASTSTELETQRNLMNTQEFKEAALDHVKSMNQFREGEENWWEFGFQGFLFDINAYASSLVDELQPTQDYATAYPVYYCDDSQTHVVDTERGGVELISAKNPMGAI